jgi:hypothetical protein
MGNVTLLELYLRFTSLYIAGYLHYRRSPVYSAYTVQTYKVTAQLHDHKSMVKMPVHVNPSHLLSFPVF